MTEIQLLEDIVLKLDELLFAVNYAYFLFKVGLACLAIYGIFRLIRYFSGFNRLN